MYMSLNKLNRGQIDDLGTASNDQRQSNIYMSLNRLNRGLLSTDGQRDYMGDIEYLSAHGLIDEDHLKEDNSEFMKKV